LIQEIGPEGAAWVAPGRGRLLFLVRLALAAGLFHRAQPDACVALGVVTAAITLLVHGGTGTGSDG
jgi:inner membrane transporter RhtA